MKLPSKITAQLIIDAISNDLNNGYCLLCGAEHDGVEPDAHGYQCDECGSHSVTGAEDIMLIYADQLR